MCLSIVCYVCVRTIHTLRRWSVILVRYVCITTTSLYTHTQPTPDPHTQTRTQTHTHTRVRLRARPGDARSGPTLNI
jgi:hypothetical protein